MYAPFQGMTLPQFCTCGRLVATQPSPAGSGWVEDSKPMNPGLCEETYLVSCSPICYGWGRPARSSLSCHRSRLVNCRASSSADDSLLVHAGSSLSRARRPQRPSPRAATHREPHRTRVSWSRRRPVCSRRTLCSRRAPRQVGLLFCLCQCLLHS